MVFSCKNMLIGSINKEKKDFETIMNTDKIAQ